MAYLHARYHMTTSEDSLPKDKYKFRTAVVSVLFYMQQNMS
jgi:hypothetical protein